MIARCAALAVVFFGASACETTPPPDSYPWAVAGEKCGERIIIPAPTGPVAPNPCAVAHGVVRAADGGEILPTYAVEVLLSSDVGGMQMVGHGPGIDLTIDQRMIRDAERYHWIVIVREHDDGPILYRTPRPQPFDVNAPIVVVVERVTGG